MENGASVYSTYPGDAEPAWIGWRAYQDDVLEYIEGKIAEYGPTPGTIETPYNGGKCKKIAKNQTSTYTYTFVPQPHMDGNFGISETVEEGDANDPVGTGAHR